MNPISALYYAAVINGLIAPLLLVMIMLISNNQRIMLGNTNGPISNILGWLATVAIGVASVALLISLALGKK